MLAFIHVDSTHGLPTNVAPLRIGSVFAANHPPVIALYHTAVPLHDSHQSSQRVHSVCSISMMPTICPVVGSTGAPRHGTLTAKQGLSSTDARMMRIGPRGRVLVHLPRQGRGAGSVPGPQRHPAARARHTPHARRPRVVHCVRGLCVWTHWLQARSRRAAG